MSEVEHPYLKNLNKIFESDNDLVIIVYTHIFIEDCLIRIINKLSFGCCDPEDLKDLYGATFEKKLSLAIVLGLPSIFKLPIKTINTIRNNFVHVKGGLFAEWKNEYDESIRQSFQKSDFFKQKIKKNEEHILDGLSLKVKIPVFRVYSSLIIAELSGFEDIIDRNPDILINIKMGRTKWDDLIAVKMANPPT